MQHTVQEPPCAYEEQNPPVSVDKYRLQDGQCPELTANHHFCNRGFFFCFLAPLDIGACVTSRNAKTMGGILRSKSNMASPSCCSPHSPQICSGQLEDHLEHGVVGRGGCSRPDIARIGTSTGHEQKLIPLIPELLRIPLNALVSNTGGISHMKQPPLLLLLESALPTTYGDHGNLQTSGVCSAVDYSCTFPCTHKKSLKVFYRASVRPMQATKVVPCSGRGQISTSNWSRPLGEFQSYR